MSEPSILVEFVDDNNPDSLSAINFDSGRRLVKGADPILVTEDELTKAAQFGVEVVKVDDKEPVTSEASAPAEKAPVESVFTPNLPDVPGQ